jgi:hypothetical protein
MILLLILNIKFDYLFCFHFSNLINRSIMTINRNKTKLSRYSLVNSKLDKVKTNETGQYCLFYNRFGRCARGEFCHLIHDPKRVALCPRFLRGTCNLVSCPFWHVVNEEKMPLCSFFAAGCCTREKCPYSHVYYGKDAEFCIEFAKGFCPFGSKVSFKTF